VIASLSDLAGLLVEFQPDTSFMSMTGTDVDSWFNTAGSDYVTLNYYGDGDGAPVWTPDALGIGRNALYFRNGKMRADVSWTCSDLTAVFVGSLDYGNATASYPRWLSVARYGVFEEDYSSPDTWVVAGYESSLHALIADRNYTRAILAPLDVSRNYIIATRKRAGTITAWLRPFGGATTTASGPTTNAGLIMDTFSVGGNMEPQNLAGLVAHIGLWSRALTDTEVLSALNYLGSLYE